MLYTPSLTGLLMTVTPHEFFILSIRTISSVCSTHSGLRGRWRIGNSTYSICNGYVLETATPGYGMIWSGGAGCINSGWGLWFVGREGEGLGYRFFSSSLFSIARGWHSTRAATLAVLPFFFWNGLVSRDGDGGWLD